MAGYDGIRRNPVDISARLPDYNGALCDRVGGAQPSRVCDNNALLPIRISHVEGGVHPIGVNHDQR